MTARNGGDGTDWKSLGTYYAGGGGNGTWNGPVGSGGQGGGGNGGTTTGGGGQAGTANRGGGAGRGQPGGSGIVIVRYSGPQQGTGGTVTEAGGYTYHTFTSSGEFAP